MKTRLFLTVVAALPAFAAAQTTDKRAGERPPVTEAPGRGSPPPAAPTENQQLWGPGADANLIAPDKARQVIDTFRASYDKLNKPRLLIYVNRELVDEASGLRMTGRKERTESVQGTSQSSFEADPNAPKPESAGTPQTQVNVAIGGGTAGGAAHATNPGKGASEASGTRVSAENTYTYKDRENPALADKQTVRDIERLFGRPLRAAGAKLADQRVAAQLIADKPLDHFTTATNEAARKDREALAKVADVVIEILISSRSITVPELSGDKTYAVPDIQATAIRLTDAAVLGQASATDVLGRDREAGRVVRRFDVKDIAEATALALMEDIALTGS
ncbi:MAG TPA: hypothetical protein VGD81_12170 [Opitutaceae bacterium]